jgi:flagellar L-ring protein precursor FlgH
MMGLAGAAQAESLFSLNATMQGNHIEPKPLFGSVRARNIGDVVTIRIMEIPSLADKGTYQTQKSSSVMENIAKTVAAAFSSVPENVNRAANSLETLNGQINVDGGTNMQRQLAIRDNVAVQVVQVMPNGNLLVQGKKSLVNAGERVDLMVSGIVDPRLINQLGEIPSTRVVNLQFAMSGSGTVSRGQSEGFFTRFIRTVF